MYLQHTTGQGNTMEAINTDTRADCYAAAHMFATGKLEVIADLLASRMDEHGPDDVTWGQVGDLGHVNDQLDEIIGFLTNRG